nr:GNAT family N-acetyltransferase [Staphylococcus saccharolyticus]
MTLEKVFVKEQGVHLQNEIDQYEDNSIHIVGYIDKNSPFAIARIRSINNYTGKVERVAVLKRHKGLNYGQNLMKTIEIIARENGYNELTIHAQVQAQDFYSKLGYTPHSNYFFEENIKPLL